MTRRRSGAGTVTTYRLRPTRRRSTNCWRRYLRWRSTCCRTTIRTSILLRYTCRSQRCAKPSRPWPEWRRSSTVRCGTCCAPPAAPSFGKGAASRDLAQPDHEPKLRSARRHSQPSHRQRHSAPGWPAQGLLSHRRHRADHSWELALCGKRARMDRTVADRICCSVRAVARVDHQAAAECARHTGAELGVHLFLVVAQEHVAVIDPA